jgi:phosphoribosylformylglycinamidine synthase
VISGGGAPRAAAVLAAATHAGFALRDCRVGRVYLLAPDPGPEAVRRLVAEVLADPVTERASVGAAPPPDDGAQVIEVGPLPGVTDVEARELQRAAARLGLADLQVSTATRYELLGEGLGPGELERLAAAVLANPTVERFVHGELAPLPDDALASLERSDVTEVVPVRELSAAELAELSRVRLLSLDAAELEAVAAWYRAEDRDPTDAELETLAQTWSEHCAHKTFKALVHYRREAPDGTVVEKAEVEGLLSTYLRAATEALWPPWLRSAFVDNAGILAFDDSTDVAIKVETHNHPSALEPFGGANTGVGGVVRDVIGVSARPVANLDVLCFGPQDLPVADLPDGVLHPRRVAAGVVAGVGDYGNKLGLPTVAGAVLVDEGYLGNPLVFCGSVGLLPAGSHPTTPRVGDRVVVLGGRTGRDGIHGATFSSADLAADTAEVSGSAVQIGDPITEKGVIELVEQARDAGLYHAITDCGAGGLSSAVGEMAARLGAEVDLADVPLKYPGLRPWEVWLSEAQERMVLAVPPTSLEALHALGERWEVEVTDLGRFTGDGRLVVRHAGDVVVDLPVDFLHDGVPDREMDAVWREPDAPSGADAGPPHADVLLALLGHPDVASKERIVRTYDHEVRGGTVVRPLCGPEGDGPSDGAVFVPLGGWASRRALALGLGINPRLGRVDPWAMAVACVDEAVRNLVAVGADPDRVALLDNFCWGNPRLPDRLGALVRACQGCHDAALAYRAPFVSGKDSLFNEFEGRPIPPTLLITALGVVPDAASAPTADLKADGDVLYLVGGTGPHLHGSLYGELFGTPTGSQVPGLCAGEPLGRYRALHRAIRDGLVASAHDLSEGGLAVAAAEAALAGRLGASIELPDGPFADTAWLFGETTGRLLVEVAPADAEPFEAVLAGQPVQRLGRVTAEPRLVVRRRGRALVDLPVAQLLEAWKGGAPW